MSKLDLSSPSSYMASLERELESANEKIKLLEAVEENLTELHNIAFGEIAKLQARIDESKKQEPIYQVLGMKSYGAVWFDVSKEHYDAEKSEKRIVYAKPIIPPDVEELYKRIDFWKSECNKHLVENAELRKQLEESKVPEGWQLVPKHYDIEAMSLFSDAVGALLDKKVRGSYAWNSDECKVLYAAMLASAPQPKEQP